MRKRKENGDVGVLGKMNEGRMMKNGEKEDDNDEE